MTNQDKSTSQPIQPVLGKPLLAQLSSDVLLNKPELSGKCPGKAWMLMLLAALPISLVYGIAAHYVGIAVGWLGALVSVIPTLLTSACGFVSWLFVIVGIAIMAVVIFGYPFLVGYLDGAYIVVALGKKGLCRNVGASCFAAAINGIFAYLGHVLITLLVSRGIQPLTYSISQLESAFDTTIVGIPVWMVVLCIVEGIIVLVGAIIGARDELKGSTFCEEHQCWYGKWEAAAYPPEINASLAASIEANDVALIESFEPVANDAFPRLSIQARSCPKGDGCDWEVKATAWWQEQTVDKRGQTTTNNKSEQWFDVLLPSEFGRQLKEKLGIKIIVPEKKKKKK
jgi:hypothetical protein